MPPNQVPNHCLPASGLHRLLGYIGLLIEAKSEDCVVETECINWEGATCPEVGETAPATIQPHVLFYRCCPKPLLVGAMGLLVERSGMDTWPRCAKDPLRPWAIVALTIGMAENFNYPLLDHAVALQPHLE